MRVRRKFLQLTRYTYPYGSESFLKSYLPEGTKKDKYGNFYYAIGEKPTTMFTCHLDTACSKQQRVNHVIQKNIIKTDGKTILGADDKAGMVVLLYMIENKVPGLYYFFIGEEVGCIGSSKLSNTWSESEYSYSISKVVSFDRRSNCSIITHQYFGRCCSEKFAEELAFKLNNAGYNLKLSPDNTGLVTDSAQFMDIIPECTNISVGYDYEHTNSEYQDIDYLTRLCKSVVSIDWESLTIERDPYNSTENEFEDEFEFGDEFDDEEYSEEYYSFFEVDSEVRKMFISKNVINAEKVLIKNWLRTLDGYTGNEEFTWNGNSLYVKNQNQFYEFLGTRVYLIPMISELSSVSVSKIKKSINYRNINIIL